MGPIGPTGNDIGWDRDSFHFCGLVLSVGVHQWVYPDHCSDILNAPVSGHFCNKIFFEPRRMWNTTAEAIVTIEIAEALPRCDCGQMGWLFRCDEPLCNPQP